LAYSPPQRHVRRRLERGPDSPRTGGKTRRQVRGLNRSIRAISRCHLRGGVPKEGRGDAKVMVSTQKKRGRGQLGCGKELVQKLIGTFGEQNSAKQKAAPS